MVAKEVTICSQRVRCLTQKAVEFWIGMLLPWPWTTDLVLEDLPAGETKRTQTTTTSASEVRRSVNLFDPNTVADSKLLQ